MVKTRGPNYKEFKMMYMPVTTLNKIKKLRHGNCKAYYRVIEMLIEDRTFDVYNSEKVERYG